MKISSFKVIDSGKDLSPIQLSFTRLPTPTSEGRNLLAHISHNIFSDPVRIFQREYG